MNIYIDDTGDFERSVATNNLRMVDGVDEIKQIIKRNLQTFLGEWFLDTSIGVPWIQEIFSKRASAQNADAILIDQVVASRGVISLLRWETSLDTATRELSVEFRALTVSGILDFNDSFDF